MKLRDALLCISCEELHDNAQRCPSCGSEAQPLAVARVIKPMPRDQVLPLAPTEEVRNVATAVA